ncbi:MAG: asparagine synthase-related protein [Thermodesulfobacteriota bacterium]
MSGLAGHVSFNGHRAPPNLMEAMAGRLAHRGRMNRELRPRPGVNICQMSGGGPASRGVLSLILDGTIYNRAELASQHGFDPRVEDADLALALYDSAGLEGLSEINGDLAAAVYDSDRDELLLFRDRFGVKPLYYARLEDEIIFASEIKALLAHPSLKAEPDPYALFDYLATHYRYIHRDPERTFYRNIRQVPAGQAVLVNENGLRSLRYWQVELDAQVARLGPEEAERRLLELLKDSVTRRLAPDQALGFSVSSGLDSSSVCSLAAAITGQPQPLYSVGYGFSEYDEGRGIVALAQRHGSVWRHLVLEAPPLLATVERLVRLADGPVCTVTWLSHYFLAQAAAQDGRKILFSGLGGDENLAGEYEHFLFFFADLKSDGCNDRLEAEVSGWIRHHDHPVFQKSWGVVEDAFQRLVNLEVPGQVRPDLKRYRAYWPYFDQDFIQTFDQPVEAANPFNSYLANRCYQDLYYETTPPCLAADDKNVSHFGLTTRFPFLDHRLVTFCFSLPGVMKYDRGVTKAVLRRAMRGLLPEANRTNTVKTGFNAPAADWLRGPAGNDVRDVIESASFRQRGWFKPGAAAEMFEDHRRGRANHMMILWQMLNLEAWLNSLSETRRMEAG